MEQKNTYSAKPMTASEIQKEQMEKQKQVYQLQLQQYQQQLLQYQQQMAMAQQLSQQYPQYMQMPIPMQLPVIPVNYPQQYLYPGVVQQPMFSETATKVLHEPPRSNNPAHIPNVHVNQYRKGKPKGKAPIRTNSPAPVKHCTPCDKDFTSIAAYEMHLKSHIQCPHCPYEAHYKNMASHQATAHGPSYYMYNLGIVLK